MKASISHQFKEYQIDLSKPIDISIPLKEGPKNVNCFYAPFPDFSPVKAGDFIGEVKQGGPVNFFNVRLNPHGNGTHTECVGHISPDGYILDHCLKEFFFKAHLISVYPTLYENGDRVITLETLELLLTDWDASKGNALILRTLPNDETKHERQYSGTNPTYLEESAMKFIVNLGIEHFLIDLPSVDREEDAGKLLSHHAFWKYPDEVRENCTISELIYVPDEIKDGDYFLNIQITSLQLDVSPSKPILYKIL